MAKTTTVSNSKVQHLGHYPTLFTRVRGMGILGSSTPHSTGLTPMVVLALAGCKHHMTLIAGFPLSGDPGV
jgi:hypothetical protein